MAAETQYTANTAMATISTANSNLDGTGTLGTVLTAAANGTLLKTVTVKAIVNTTQGMVRLFIYDGVNTKLIAEVEIPAVTKGANDTAFEAVLTLNFSMKAAWVLKASTEKGESFNIIAEGLDWAYYTTSVRSDTTKYTAYNAATTVSTANSNLDGTGTLGTPLISVGAKGTILQSITIKAKVNTTAGMIRIYINDGASTTKLLTEVPVSAVTKSATAQSFYHKIRFPDGFALKSAWQLRASTEKAEAINVIPESLDLSYPA